MNKKLLISFLLLVVGMNVAIADHNVSCGNDAVGQQPDGDPLVPYTGNEIKHIKDLQIWGGVGHHQLNWSRYGNSRAVPNSDLFGQGHYWRHTYEWDLVTAGTNTNGQSQLTLTEPSGIQWDFTQISSSQWSASIGCPYDLIPQGNNFILQSKQGPKYNFTYTASGTTICYMLTSFTDDAGDIYTLTYNSANLLSSISEPAGRSLQVSYAIQNETNSAITNLAIVYNAPAYGQWMSLPVTDTNAYRYVRVLAADGSYGNLAEVQFYDTNGNLLTGTIISSDLNQATNAFDGNTNTSFISASQSGSYVGLDLGTPTVIGRVRILATPGSESLMVPAQFDLSSVRAQGLNSAPTSLTVISNVATSDGRSVQYSYTTFNDPVLPMSYPTLTGVTYGDGTTASYTYGQIFGGTRPLITAYNDVRCTTPIQNNQTVYNSQYATTIIGFVDHQVNPATGGTIAALGSADGGYHCPTITFANGATRARYFTDGLMTSFSDGNQYITHYGYDTNGFVNSITNALGHVTSYSNNIFGSVLSQTNDDGSVESWTYNSLNSLSSQTDTLGRITTWIRDTSNRVIEISYPDGSGESYTYNNFSQVLTHILRSGGTESFIYDSEGNLLSKSDAMGNATTYGYDSSDRLNSVTDAHGNTTTMVYNERGLLTQINNPDGSSRSKTYNATGDLISESNELGNAWGYSYDPTFHLLLSVTDPLGRTVQYNYLADSLAKPNSVTLPSGKQTTFAYGLEWEPLSTTVGAGSPNATTTSYTYDWLYNLITTVDGDVQSWLASYDMRNRKISASDPLGNKTMYTYDTENNLLTITRPDGKVATNGYDSMNRPTRTTDPAGNVTSLTYDNSGNPLTLTDAKGMNYSNSYDLLSHRLSMTYPDATQEKWTYDCLGNIATYTTRLGQVATYTYDNRNQNIAYSWSDGTPAVARTYDVAGRLLTLSNSASVDSYVYDISNQLLSESQTIAGESPHTVSYSYDQDGNRITLNYPAAWQMTYSYDGCNRLTDITSGVSNTVATISYDGNGNRLAKTLGNGVATTYNYDLASRLTTETNSIGTGSNSVVAGYTYSLNSLGLRLNRSETTVGGTAKEMYGYDPLCQITSATYASGRTVKYVYDVTGNWTNVTTTNTSSNSVVAYMVNPVNEYTKVGSSTTTCDKNGNLTTDQNGNSYTYDAQNRLVKAVNSGNVTQFAYDARNRAVSRTVNGTTTTTFVYDGWNLIDEYDTLGVEDAYYVRGPGTDEILTRNPTGGAPIFYTQDGNWNVTAITGTSGSVEERYTYDVYGAVSIYNASGNYISSTGVGNRFLFNGREYLAGPQIYDYRYRIYSPRLGRFLQTDPIRFEGGDLNIYRYCWNNPVNWVDPLGLWAVSARSLPGWRGTVVNAVNGDNASSDHWQIFYDNGDNDGYHPQGEDGPEFGPDPSPGPWNTLYEGDDDCKMSKAEQTVQNEYQKNGVTYDAFNHNCQNYVNDVLNEYARNGGTFRAR